MRRAGVLGAAWAAQGGAPAPWHPSALFQSGEQGGAWDFTDVSGMFTDDGTTNVSAPDDPIYRVNDISGNGKHMRRETDDTRRPLYKVNGSGYALTDGSNDHLLSPLDFTLSVGWTVFTAMRPVSTGTPTGESGFSGLYKSSVNFALASRRSDVSRSSTLIRVAALTIGQTLTIGASSDFPVSTDCYTKMIVGNGSLSLYRNGSLIVTGDANSFDGADSDTGYGFSFGGLVLIGSVVRGYRAIAINRAVTVDEEAEINAWLQAGYVGITS